MAFRHELKFLISEAEEKALQERWKPIISYDKHAGPGGYTIRSLYFDDYYEAALYDKLAGVNERQKYRIRIYDGRDDVIRLERKEKVGQYIRKTGASLGRAGAGGGYSAGEAGGMFARPEKLCQDFYMETVMNGLHPVVLVDYDRLPFVFPYGDVRVTFDEHVRAGAWAGDLFDMDTPAYEVLPAGSLHPRSEIHRVPAGRSPGPASDERRRPRCGVEVRHVPAEAGGTPGPAQQTSGVRYRC